MSTPLKLLLIEDSEDDALLVVRVLRQGGFTLIWERVQTAAALRQALTQPGWDIIISDFRLPGFDAPAALEIVKHSQQDIPFVVVSGTIGDAAAVDLMKAGAQDYLMKDNLARLPEAVRRELREAQMRAERKQADIELDRTKERLQFAIEGSGIGTWDWCVQTGDIQINDRCAEIIGYRQADIKPMQIDSWQQFTHPEDAPKKQAALDRHFRGETPTYECEFRMRHRLGHWIWVLDRGKVVERDPHGQPLRIAGTHLDITDRKQAELRLALQNSILERIAQLDPLPDILDALVRSTEEQIEGGLCSILLCDRTGKLRHGAAPHLPAAYCQALDGLLIGPEVGSCGTAAFCREIVIVADIATDPLWQDFRELALAYGLKSCWSAPAVGSQDEVLATFAIYFHECRSPQGRELDTLTLAANIAKIAIERHRAEASLGKRDRYLSALVQVQHQLLSAPVDQVLYQRVLQVLGPISDADRIYIFENHLDETGQLVTSQKAEWCAPGITPQIDNLHLQNLSYEQIMPGWRDILSQGGIINSPVSEFLEPIRSELADQEIRSILILPLLVSGSFFGFIGFDNCVEVKQWDTLEVGLLSSAAAAIALAKERENTALALAQLNRDLEGRVEQRTAALQESESRLQAILNSAPAAIYVKDLAGRHTFVNQAFLELFGCQAAEVIGKTNHDFFPPEIAHRLQANDQAVLMAGKVQQFEEDFDIHGNHRTFLSNKFLLLDLKGQPYALCGISTDISERKQAEAQLQRTNAELARATRLKDEFLANMSHELRTPLNAILGMSEALQEEVFGMLNDRQRRAITTVWESGKHLLDLINDILDLSKIEAGKLELMVEEIPVQSLCSASLSFVKQMAFSKQIQLTASIPDKLKPLSLQVDGRRMRQVLINLLSNAVKFTPNGGRVSLNISLEDRPPSPDSSAPQSLCFAIQDTGIGIADADLSKLFQSFVQIDSSLSRQYAGTGLGLALVKRITHLHGGSVSVTSAVGQGSCFTVRLPLTLPPHLIEDDVFAEGTEAPLRTASGTPPDQPLILLAEDNEANVMTISGYLAAKGYQVLVADSGQTAITLAQTRLPDLILMDIQMPGMDGLEAIRQIRQDPSLADLPIIALTALAMPGDKEKCLQVGANEYLAKPVRLQYLAATIQQMLADRQAPG